MIQTKRVSKWTLLASSRLRTDNIGPAKASNHTLSDNSSLSDQLAEVYRIGDTDGVQDLIARNSNLLHDNSGRDLLLACIEATSSKPGEVASLMNSLIASCVNFDNPNENNAAKAIELLEEMEESEISIGVNVRPDIVSYCCAFSACSNLDLDPASNSQVTIDTNTKGLEILERLTRLTKKQAGGKRRKLINASKRKSKSRNSNQNTNESLSSANLQLLNDYPDFQILYEDDNYIGVCKPSAMTCYHRHKTTKGKHEDMSLEDLLLKCFQSTNDSLSTLNPDALGIVHRLDRGTSGCILLAKTNEAHALLLTAFFKRQVKKSYLALLPAQIEELTHGEQEQQQDDQQQSFELENLSLKSTGMIDLPVDGKPALSSYTVEQFHATPPLAMTVRMNTFTGRKHQVRVHCANGLKRPLFLEPLYTNRQVQISDTKKGKKSKSKQTSKPKSLNSDKSNVLASLAQIPSSIQEATKNITPGHRFFLHAHSLQVLFLGINMQATLPQWWTRAIDGIEEV